MKRFEKIRKLVGNEEMAMKIIIEVDENGAKIAQEKAENTADKELRMLYESGFNLLSVTPGWITALDDEELKTLFKEEFDRAYKIYKDILLSSKIAEDMIKRIKNQRDKVSTADRIVKEFLKK